MRSRYCAYRTGDQEYLESSWHADFRPERLEIDKRLKWLGLTIISTDQHRQRAMVEFEARYLLEGRVDAVHESSRFVLQGGRWLYTDGDPLAPGFRPWKPGRNESCPCGSGKKFKHCCAGS